MAAATFRTARVLVLLILALVTGPVQKVQYLWIACFASFRTGQFSKLLLIWLNIQMLASMTIETSARGAGVSKLLARAYMFRTLNLIALLVYVVLCVMLLVGGRKKKPEYLRHFFMTSLVMTVYDVVVTGFAILYLRHWSFAIALLWIATNVYSLLVVRSSFLAMEEKERGLRPAEPEEEVCWDTMQLAHVV